MTSGSPLKKADPLSILLQKDPYLEPYRQKIDKRLKAVDIKERELLTNADTLSQFALAHLYYGLHETSDGLVFREWAPNANAMFLIGDFSQWRESDEYALERIDDHGNWEIHLPHDALIHGDLFRLRLHWNGGEGDRMPVYVRRAAQDPITKIFNAQVWAPPDPYVWRHEAVSSPARSLLIYEAHVGMAQEDGKIGSFEEFRINALPRVIEAGYDTLQLMAIQEHPYYASFGYHVSNFFAVSSRFGAPEDLKRLVDEAHGAGLRVIMDLIHSHAVSNEVEGISRFDGTLHQFFHNNPRGYHYAWDSRCFDYGKPETLHFLLSNCRFWLEEFRLDGFRLDGVTSMLYLHHGLEKAFTSYDDYFDDSVDEQALVYLALANRLIHDLNPAAVTIAEDMSGMPGLAASREEGGYGFDYRLAMGVPDYWIKLIKEVADESWPLGTLWHELNNRRHEEKCISYTESHDQALVGDQTLMFRLAGADMYDHMNADSRNHKIERAMALHKMMRLITMAAAGNGYLNFMGNEFGHPEWIDFPREGNNWSYHYARRQWSLVDNPRLRYRFLQHFDRRMIKIAKDVDLLTIPEIYLRHEHNDDKTLAFQRADLLFVFNFHPHKSYVDYRIETPPGQYRLILDSDAAEFGGHERLTPDQTYFTQPENEESERRLISLYLPSRAAIILKKRGRG